MGKLALVIGFSVVSFLSPTLTEAASESTDEIFQINCNAGTEESRDSLNLKEKLTITVRPTYGASLVLDYDGHHRASIDIDFAKDPTKDRLTVKFVDVPSYETIYTSSSTFAAKSNEFSFVVKAIDKSKTLKLTCSIERV